MSHSVLLVLGVQQVHDTGGYRFKVAYQARFGRARMQVEDGNGCLLYTSPSPRDRQKSRMPSSA